jgi:arylsulfatase A-like enzyme
MGTMRAGAILKQALWFGLLTGLIEAALLGVKRLYLGRFIRFGPDLAWLAPLSDALAFLAVGLLLVACARLWRRLARPAVVTFVLAFLAFLSVLLLYYPLHLYAKALLAAGLATQVARLVSRRPQPFERVVGRGLVVTVTIVALLAAGARAIPWFAYQRHVTQMPAAVPGTPNVLLIVWDTVRARNLSVYGYGRRTTPTLERLAASSVVFDHASSTSPWTLPSHASMLTGRWPHELSATWEQALDRAPRTLAEALTDRGYLTAGFVANTYYCGHELGLARGFGRYEDYVVSLPELVISSSLVRSIVNSWPVRRLIGYHDNLPRRSAAEITDHFLAWQRTTGPRPFFAFLNFFDAHETYLPPAPFAGAFGPGPPDGSPAVIQDVRRSLRRDWSTRPAGEIQAELNFYDGAIAYLDDQLNRLLAELESRGALDNTIVIITSDHGEQFGEHGLYLHGNSLYRPLLDVPLIVRFPAAAPGGRRIGARVTLRDLPATVFDLMGVRDRQELPGASLSRHWHAAPSGENAGADAAVASVDEAEWAKVLSPWYPAAKGDMASVTDDAFHYIRNGDGSEELYAIADLEERDDLSKRADSVPVLERYRALLRAAGAKGSR